MRLASLPSIPLDKHPCCRAEQQLLFFAVRYSVVWKYYRLFRCLWTFRCLSSGMDSTPQQEPWLHRDRRGQPRSGEAGVAPPVSSRLPASRSACHRSTSANSGARLPGLGLEGVWTRSASAGTQRVQDPGLAAP